MHTSMMHTTFFPDSEGKVEFGCTCDYDREYYLDDEDRDPIEQKYLWERSRALREEDENRDLWDEVESYRYKNGEKVFKTRYEHKPLTYEQREDKEDDFNRKISRWIAQKKQNKYPQNDPRKHLYCIVEAISPQPGFEKRSEEELKALEKIFEQDYAKFHPDAHIETPASLGKLVIRSEDNKPVFDFYPNLELQAWSIPELLDPSSSARKLAAGVLGRGHMADVLEAQEGRTNVLYRGNLERCGWILPRSLTNEHIRHAFWSKPHVFWMPVDIEVDPSATGQEVIAYRNFLRANKTLTKNIEAVLSQINKGEDNRLWSSRDIKTVTDWSDIRILFLRYLRHHTLKWNFALPEPPAPPKSLVRRVRDSPALNGTNLVIFSLVLAILGLLIMLGYLIFFKSVRVL